MAYVLNMTTLFYHFKYYLVDNVKNAKKNTYLKFPPNSQSSQKKPFINK